ncbi:hypothetical protein [Rhodococcus sp. IEGM 1318]|nr:hypothetical protein [Rhodococcus sp. IEGM 1318]MDV8009264.1 hypothetical protein [Rhodococcus sp. IEGM 1318]
MPIAANVVDAVVPPPPRLLSSPCIPRPTALAIALTTQNAG